jgi:hypothetical protein
MNKTLGKSLTSAALGLALAFSGATGAFAVDEPTTTPVPISSPVVAKKDRVAIARYIIAKNEFQVANAAFKAGKQTYAGQLATYKVAMAELKPALTAYASAKKVIGQTFASAVSAARTTYKQAIAGEATAEQKLAAKTSFDSAKAAAASARAAAITALGTAPLKPAAPVKPTKPVKPTRP